MLVATAENDRFRFFRRGLLSIRAGAWIRAPTRRAVVGGRVDTRPYEAGGRRRARRYAPLRGAAAAWGLPFRHKRPPYGSCCRIPIALSERPLIRHPASVRRRMPPSPQGGKALSEPRLLLPYACCLLPNLPVSDCLLPAADCLFHPSPAGASSLRAEERPDRREK